MCPLGAESEGAKRISLWVTEGTSVNGSLDSLQIFLGNKAEEISSRSNGFSDLVLAPWPSAQRKHIPTKHPESNAKGKGMDHPKEGWGQISEYSARLYKLRRWGSNIHNRLTGCPRTILPQLSLLTVSSYLIVHLLPHTSGPMHSFPLPSKSWHFLIASLLLCPSPSSFSLFIP